MIRSRLFGRPRWETVRFLGPGLYPKVHLEKRRAPGEPCHECSAPKAYQFRVISDDESTIYDFPFGFCSEKCFRLAHGDILAGAVRNCERGNDY